MNQSSKVNALYSMAVPHNRVRTPVGSVSLTRQEFAAECDINRLMARYEKTGMFPVDAREPRYLDLTDVPDFQSAMQLMIDANEAFMSLPAVVRRDFDNDPGKFVAFAEDPENLERMREWGLAPPAVVSTVVSTNDNATAEGGGSPDTPPPPASEERKLL